MAITNALIGHAVDDDKKFAELDAEDKVGQAVSEVNSFFDYFNQNILASREDQAFVMTQNGQWDPELFSIRTQSQQPCFQINNVYAIVTSLLGKQRKKTPSFKVFSFADESNPKVHIDQETIDLRENLLRQISFDQNAPVKFQTAFKNALVRSYGAIIVGLEYENAYSFNQKITINAPEDSTLCFWDPADRSINKTEGRFSGWMEHFTTEEFRSAYPEAKSSESSQYPSSFPTSSMENRQDDRWYGKDFIAVAHFFRKETFPIRIYQLNDGRSMSKKDAEDAIAEDRATRMQVKKQEKSLMGMIMKMGMQQEKKPSMLDTINALDYAYDEAGKRITRMSEDYKIIHYEMVKDEILNETLWPSKKLPVVYVDGDSNIIDGQQLTKSFVSTAKDPQRILNYIMSEAVGNLINSHKSQWLGCPENFAGYENIWRDPSIPQGALIANYDSRGALPTKVPPPEISPSYMPLMAQSMQDIQNALGYFNANQGKDINNESGRAVDMKQRRGDLANFIYEDNLERAVDETYKIVLSLVPATHDSNRAIIIRNQTGEQHSVNINEKMPDGSMKNDMTKGNYSVETIAGSDYDTQLMQNMEQLTNLMEILAPVNPQVALALSDLFAANTNLTNTPQIVDRMRAIIMGMSPKDILSHEMGLKPAPPPPQQQGPDPAMMQFQIQQMHEQNEAKQIEINQQKLQVESEKIKMEMQRTMMEAQKSRDEIEMKKIELERERVAAHAEIEKNKAQAEMAKHKEKAE